MDHENQDIPQSGQGNEPREVVLRYEAPVTPHRGTLHSAHTAARTAEEAYITAQKAERT